MYYILPFFLFINVIVTNFFYSSALSSIESAIDSVSKSTLKLCIVKKFDEVNDIDDLYIDQEKFETLYLKQFQSNLDFYLGVVEVSFAYYNAPLEKECNNINLSCNGVQIKIKSQIIPYIAPLEKYIRYEIKENQLSSYD
ncbi:TPA: hypothetical protein GXZ54_01405 [bacterium]|jgi:hypothetical protein|nr:hypothetical protein [bacterium]